MHNCLRQLLQKLHSRLGDLWWFTIMLFAAQRVADVINVFVGLWLVPRYVPQSELGAVLPLTQFASFVGIPLAIVSAPFMKFLGIYAERGETGKVKAFLRDVFVGSAVMSLATLVFAWVTIPFFFQRMRVEVGSLGILVVLVSLTGALSTIFQSAVQGLKLYSATVLFNIVSAPVRLMTMALTMPFRPISGYFAGQGAASGGSILAALWMLRKKLGSSVKPQSYWREDGAAILRYTLAIAIFTVSSIVFVSVDQLVIRHRLSDFESAGYYIISRFSDIAVYIGSAFAVFLFPMVSNATADKTHSKRILTHASLGTLGSGLLVAVLLYFFGENLLSLTSAWVEYKSLSFEMVLLAVSNTILWLANCFNTYEMAQGRFKFLWIFVPLFFVKSLVLYALTGFSFFEGMLPASWLSAVVAFNPNRLIFVICFTLAFQLCYIPLYYLLKIKHND